nr:MAG TPA: hypothetical protein [Crassvirales sp.]
MSVEEMDNVFDVLYNNITSNQAPGLNAYEKSVFLTKGQDEILKNYFNPKSKGNTTQDGFDENAKRQVDFSMLTSVETKSSGFEDPLFDTRENTKSVGLPSKLMFAINEVVEVTRNNKQVILQVIPIKFNEYSRLMCKPYKRPLKYQAWRLTNNNTSNKADIIIGPSDTLTKYTIRYVRRPNPIIVSDLDGLTIENKSTATECELDPILHEEILQRAVELAKVAWTNTGQDNLQAVMQAGQRNE